MFLWFFLVGVMHANHAIMAILITVKMEDLEALSVYFSMGDLPNFASCHWIWLTNFLTKCPWNKVMSFFFCISFFHLLRPSVRIHLAFFIGALCEPLSCILHGWDRLQMVNAPQPDSKIVIMGAGIIGNLWICLLHHYGFRDVIVSEPSPIRRKLAAQLGRYYHRSYIYSGLHIECPQSKISVFLAARCLLVKGGQNRHFLQWVWKHSILDITPRY